jgi:acyl transferase domain-containing protein/SAM-dependent methyltransferase
MSIRTGCSAALVALHEACRAIQNGDCKSAIVGGANLILAPGMTQAMTEQGVLSPDGSCKTFSADANGYGRGEAVSAIYIKPLDAALRDGNPVRAVIKATATNSDGRTPGISYPSTESHEAMIRKAYASAGITDFSRTTFVECHGTGTPTGDPIEANAVARVFGGSERGVYIGSVKPNLGHSEGASGLTSLIKVVLALENRIIPPQIRFSSPNPNIPFEERNLKVPLEPTPWPQDGGERASVNSFGIGGANAHAIVESARTHGVVAHVPVAARPSDSQDIPHLLLYSANSSDSLRRMVEAYQTFVDESPEKLGALAYTLANGREHLQYRAFAVASKDRQPTVSPLTRIGQSPKVVMVFTGQGAQWPTMGKELLQSNAVFQASVRSLDQHLRDILGAPEWSIEEELLKTGKSSRMGLAELSQPLCTALQVALVDTLAAVGVRPTAVVGHSSGEIAAAYAAGALTAKESIIIAWHRGQVAKKQQRAGSMAAIGMGWDDVKPYLVDTVTVACENSPRSVTISGDTDKVQAVVAKIKESPPNGQEVLARLLKVDKAYHSYHMVEIGEDYHSLLMENGVLGADAAFCSFYSSVTGGLLEEEANLGPRYWQKNLESPVLFSAAVTKILQNPELGKQCAFLEVGPHSAMAGPLRQIMTQVATTAPYVSTMIRNQNCVESFLTAIGKLHQLNVPVDLGVLIPRGSTSCLPDLPRYAWDHEESYWYESRLCKEWRHRKHAYHDLLGVRVAESTDLEPAWRNMFHLDNAPWVRDHKIVNDIVFPFAGYVAMAGEAVRQTSGIQQGYSLRHIIVSTALVITEGRPVELLTTFRPHRLTDHLDSQWWEFTVASHNGQLWTKHCTGQVRALEGSLGTAEEPLPPPRRLETRKAYSIMQQVGLNYGPHFQGLDSIGAGTTEQTATATVATNRHGDEHRYHLHPVIIDACLQLLSVAATKGYTRRHGMVVPTNIEELSIHRCASDVKVAASAEVNRLGAITGAAQCIADGEAVLIMSGARLSPLPGEESSDSKDTHATARYEWGPHIDFMDEKDLIGLSKGRRATYTSVLDEITCLCIVYSQRRLESLNTEVEHMQRYRSWIYRQLELHTAAVSQVQSMEDHVIFDKVLDLVKSLSETPAADAALAMFKIMSSITAIVSGQVNPLEILLTDDTLTKVNSLRDDACDRSALIRHLAHSRPNLRILELGAGTGVSTSSMLKDLVLAGGRVLFSTYTFSDPSAGMVTAAKERFKDVPNMQYSTLDIGRDLAEQDFQDDHYDLVIATNVIHATPNLSASLENVRKLLHPNGRLLLQELSSSSKWINFIFGVLPWWWSGGADGRVDEPYVNLERWESTLATAGLKKTVALVDDDEPFQLNNIIVARPADTPKASAKEITLLCRDTTASAVGRVAQELEKMGFAVHKRALLGDDELNSVPKGEDVVALLEQDSPFFSQIDEVRYEAFKHLVAGGGSIFWVTAVSQMSGCRTNPAYAQILGTARTLRSETSVDFATCEVDDVAASAGLIAEVFANFQARRGMQDDAVGPDFEYAIVDGVVHVGRFFPFSLASELLSTDASDRVILETEKPGLLAALKWARRASTPLQGDYVEVQTYAAGLNFRVRLVKPHRYAQVSIFFQ